MVVVAQVLRLIHEDGLVVAAGLDLDGGVVEAAGAGPGWWHDEGGWGWTRHEGGGWATVAGGYANRTQGWMQILGSSGEC